MSIKRDYENTNSKVYNHYKNLRSNQTLQFVKKAHQKYCTTFDLKLNVQNAIAALDQFIDSSDPDLVGVSNIHHSFQTAEDMRLNGEPEWFQLIGFIHDLGKIIFLKKEACDKDGTSVNEQWAVGGDTFIVGCKLSDKLVYPDLNQFNPDSHNPKYNSKYGIYKPHCGFDNCHFSFGHDEYLYQLLKYNIEQKSIAIDLPEEALYIVRYHSFYPFHRENAYTHLASEKDLKMKHWLQKFSNYDLYTKDYSLPNIENLRDYYNNLIKKYIKSDFLYF